MQCMVLEKILAERKDTLLGQLSGVHGLEGGVCTHVDVWIWKTARGLCNGLGLARCTQQCLGMMGYYVCSLPPKDLEKE